MCESHFVYFLVSINLVGRSIGRLVVTPVTELKSGLKEGCMADDHLAQAECEANQSDGDLKGTFELLWTVERWQQYWSVKGRQKMVIGD